MPTIQNIRKSAIDKLRLADFDTAKLDVDLLLGEAFGLSTLDIILNTDLEVDLERESIFQEFIVRRLAHEPVAQILGRKDFWTHTFKISRNCLTPRPDSETLIETALTQITDKKAVLKILDLGTGSGCLLLSLLSELPNSLGVGVDISKDALALARDNAEQLNLSARCDFVVSNWAEQLPPDEKFDIILCNPPYIDEDDLESLALDVVKYEPHTALFAKENGLKEYKSLSEIIPSLVADKGRVFLEIGHDQAQQVTDIFIKVGAKNMRTIVDIAERDRCVTFDFA
ncbi:MAG: peptide chain release factor N(5)-glutamine methyltransferase [Emcibacter sp.]|nr:peptide chain release factor N(5)-glutamine methyltransferase [Emcibacter sp.]